LLFPGRPIFNSFLVRTPVHPVPIPLAPQSVPIAQAALALTGFSAVLAQILLLRELIVVFNGNEMSLGILLAVWLFWTAAGSSLLALFRVNGNHARPVAAALEILLAVSLPPSLWALRASKIFFQSVPGELVGPVPMLLTTLVCLSVVCLVSGALFVAATRWYESASAIPACQAAGSAYLLEAAGSGAGGILASLLLLRFLHPFQIALLVSLLNLAMAAALLFRIRGKKWIAVAATAALLAIPLLAFVAPVCERSAQARLWQGFSLIGSHDSIYGNLTVTETAPLRSLYDNGMILANAPDPAAAEEAVHYALLEHPAPRRILMIGGSVNGSIAQALQHPSIERIDSVELDPALAGMARAFFPAQAAALSDPRVHTHAIDGRLYLKQTSDRFDEIILNLPDPQTAQLNRFYTVEFFRTAREHLAPGGVFALELHSSEEAISPDLAAFLRCIHRTLAEVFPSIATIPGETLHFFATAQPGLLHDDPQTLIAHMRERKLQTDYVREYFIPYRMTPDRMEQMSEVLQPRPSTPVNRDFAPIAYYFDIALWSAQFKSSYAEWFREAAQFRFTSVLAFALSILVSAAFALWFFGKKETRARRASANCIAATGFTQMALQILLLLAFQSIYGYVYSELAMLVAMGMAGIALGSWLGTRRCAAHRSGSMRDMTALQLMLLFSAPVFLLSMNLLEKCSSTAAAALTAQCLFPALAALSGMLGGSQFALAAQVYLREESTRSGLGTLYAIDLIGGCAGALLLSTYVIPVFGFWKTAWLTAAINLLPALFAAATSSKLRSQR
jgi:spermidine synthase